MPDYKTMYDALFNLLTGAMEILQKAQQEGERLFARGTDKINKEQFTSCDRKPE